MNRLFSTMLIAAFAALASDFAATTAPVRKPKGESGIPEPFTNSIGMKFVWIPPGSFKMGSPPNEAERLDDETQHTVTLSRAIYMGIHFFTQEQWQTVMGDNPSHFTGAKSLPGIEFPGMIARSLSRKCVRGTRSRIVCRPRPNGNIAVVLEPQLPFMLAKP